MVRAPLRPGRRWPRVSAEPPQTEDPAQIRGLFAAANREFESTEVSDRAQVPLRAVLGAGLPRCHRWHSKNLRLTREISLHRDIPSAVVKLELLVSCHLRGLR